MENQTAIIKVNPLEDQAVIALQGEANKLLRYANDTFIDNETDVKVATNDLSILSKLKKAIEEKRKEYVGPINDHIKAVNETFKTISAPVEQADKITRDKVMAYRREQQEKAAEIERINQLRIEAAQAEAKLNNGEIKESVNLIDAPPTPPANVRTEVGTLGTMKVRKFEVVNIREVPIEYLKVDEVAIGRLVRAGIPSIPGIRIWEEEVLKVNAK